MEEKRPEDITTLLLGFCIGKLSPEQERALLRRAANDQDIFNRLMEIDALRDALSSPSQRQRLLSALQTLPAQPEGEEQGSDTASSADRRESVSGIWRIPYGCPSVEELSKAATSSAAERETVNSHIAANHCVRCSALLGFLSGSSDPPDAWIGAVGGTVLNYGEGNGVLTVLQPLNPFGIRVSCERGPSGVTVRITSIDPAHAAQDAELWLLTSSPRRIRATMRESEPGVLFAAVSIDPALHFSQSTSALPFLLRVREAKSVRQNFSRLSSFLLDWWHSDEHRLDSLEPSVAVIGTSHDSLSQVAGIVCEVQQSLLLLQLAPHAVVSVGRSIRLQRAGVFIASAIVIGVEAPQVTCEFHAAGSELPRPGDLAINETEE